MKDLALGGIMFALGFTMCALLVFGNFERDRTACAREHNVFACKQVIQYVPLTEGER
jgi:hypothetical protein